MGLRYVWEKWNTNKGYAEKTYSRDSSQELGTNLRDDNTNYPYYTKKGFTNGDLYPVSYAYGDGYELHTDTNGYWISLTGTIKTGKLSSSSTAIPDGKYFTTAYDDAKGQSNWNITQNRYAQISRANNSTANLYIEIEVSEDTGTTFTIARCTANKRTDIEAQYTDIKGSTSYGNVSSASSGAYPTNGKSGDYWYVKKGNDTIDPASVTYPASPNGGELIDITIAPSTGIKFGGTVKYKVEYQLNGRSWQTASTSTTATTVSVLIPKGTQTFAARATASDNTGFTSTTAVTGATVNVVNNATPVISCGTSNLGEIAEPFSVTYSVSDEDGDTMTITEKIDGTTIRSYSAPSSSGEQTFSPDAMQWLTTLNGSHTATITADDGKDGVTTHSISFTRAVYTMSVTLEEPMETDAAITKCVVNIAKNIPDDAEWSLLVTNNAFDPEPVWEDITQYVKNGWNWVFDQTVTSGRYGFNFKLTCTRGASSQGGYVDTISGGFE